MVPFRPTPKTAKGKVQWREVKVAILARLGTQVTRAKRSSPNCCVEGWWRCWGTATSSYCCSNSKPIKKRLNLPPKSSGSVTGDGAFDESTGPCFPIVQWRSSISTMLQGILHARPRHYLETLARPRHKLGSVDRDINCDMASIYTSCARWRCSFT